MDGLSIIIPVYNEEKALTDSIVKLHDLLNTHPDFEVIYVDDGSTDRTPIIFKEHLHDRMKLIIHKQNAGYGAAIKSGVKQASHKYIAIIDADGSYPIERMVEFFQTLLQDEVDMIVGARTGKVVKIDFIRRIPKYFLKRLSEYLIGSKIPDLNSGMRIIRKDLIQNAMHYLPDGFSFTTTITLILLSNRQSVRYIPIDYYQRIGKSKISPFSDTANFIQLIIRTIMLFNPLKVFLPVGFFFILLSITIMIVTYILGRVMDITTILLFTTGFQIISLGLLADLINRRVVK